MKLFYIAAYAAAPARVWDAFLLAEDEADARAKVAESPSYQTAVLCGYAIQRVHEMRTPPMAGITDWPLLDSEETAGEGWARVVAGIRGEVAL